MSIGATSRRRWTDETIETELRARCAEFGHFPTRAELVACGARGLWDAMRSADGVEAWRERVEASPSASHEEIATRAYELYKRGAPGDHLAHWLAAEDELTSAPSSRDTPRAGLAERRGIDPSGHSRQRHPAVANSREVCEREGKLLPERIALPKETTSPLDGVRELTHSGYFHKVFT